MTIIINYQVYQNNNDQVYKDLAFCENPLEREQEVEDVKVEKIRSLQEVTFLRVIRIKREFDQLQKSSLGYS